MEEKLIAMARQAMERAYAPYSRFQVGAALLCADGSIYTGCNVENASYGATNCAERTAFFKAVSDGKREFTAIAIVGGPHGQIQGLCPPCGICRQVMAEFCQDDFRIILADGAGVYRKAGLSELLPLHFSAENL